MKLPHRILHISAPEDLPNSVVFVGQNGECTITDQDLNVQHTHTFEGESDVQKVFVFNRSEATFVPKRWSLKDGAVIVTVAKTVGALRIRVVGIDESGIRVLGDLPLPVDAVSILSFMVHPPVLKRYQTILDISCSASGFISVMSRFTLFCTWK